MRVTNDYLFCFSLFLYFSKLAFLDVEDELERVRVLQLVLRRVVRRAPLEEFFLLDETLRAERIGHRLFTRHLAREHAPLADAELEGLTTVVVQVGSLSEDLAKELSGGKDCTQADELVLHYYVGSELQDTHAEFDLCVVEHWRSLSQYKVLVLLEH